MQNPNEFRDPETNELWIKAIKKCYVQYKEGDNYFLSCSIHQRGEHNYQYCPNNFAALHRGNHHYKICENAICSLNEAIAKFHSTIDEIKNETNSRFDVPSLPISLYLHRNANGTFNVLKEQTLECQPIGNVLSQEYYPDVALNRLFHLFSWHKNLTKEQRELMGKIFSPSRDTLHQNLVYQYAVRTDNYDLQCDLEMQYGAPDETICNYLSKRDGVKRLPCLPAEFDHEYVIDAYTISRDDYQVLNRSGYTILHRPYFAMKGYTHGAVELNPHTKHALDAAPVIADTISFEEYMRLFQPVQDSAQPD